MRAYRVTFGGGLESLRLIEIEEPAAARQDVVVEIRAASLNFRELMILGGRYPLPVASELVPACDGAGEVVAAGTGVRGVRVGDRVMISVFPRWFGGPFRLEDADQIGGSLDGTLAERIAVDARAVVPIPRHLSYAEASTLPCAGVTAWNALTGGGGMLGGAIVLTIGSGGVALFSLQFAKLLGGRVIATTSSETKAEQLRAIGADQVVNYRGQPQWGEVVREMASGRGCDLIVEVGGTGTLGQSMRALAPDGTIALVGGLAPMPQALDPTLFRGVFTLRRIAVGSVLQFQQMTRLVDAHHLRPIIDRVFEFGQTRDAFEYLQKRTGLGKVVITIP